MKTLLPLCFMLSGMTVWSQPLTDEIIEVTLDQNKSDVDTICGFKNSLLRIPFDTFYVINGIAVEDFRICRQSYSELSTELAKLEDISDLLVVMETDFDSLMANMHSLESLYGASLQNSIKNAETLMGQNTTLQTNLNTALSELSEAKQKIKNERWNKLGTKMIWAAGGLVIGVLAVTATD